MSTFGQVKQFANFECQLKIYESLYFGRTWFKINVHVFKDWKISFITSERTISLPKNKNRISFAKTLQRYKVAITSFQAVTTNRWTDKWKLAINEKKSVHVDFTLWWSYSYHPLYIETRLIPGSTHAKYLGIFFDQRLNY